MRTFIILFRWIASLFLVYKVWIESGLFTAISFFLVFVAIEMIAYNLSGLIDLQKLQWSILKAAAAPTDNSKGKEE